MRFSTIFGIIAVLMAVLAGAYYFIQKRKASQLSKKAEAAETGVEAYEDKSWFQRNFQGIL